MTEEKKTIVQEETPVIEESVAVEETTEEVKVESSSDDLTDKELDIITQGIADAEKYENISNEEFKKEFLKLKETNTKVEAQLKVLEEQKAAMEKQSKELEVKRKGLATIPVSGESQSAQPVRKDPEEEFNKLTPEQKYQAFEEHFLGRR